MKTLALATVLLVTTGVQAASDADTPPASDDSHYHLTRIRLGLDEDSEQTSGVYRTTTDKQYLQLDNQTDSLTFYISDGRQPPYSRKREYGRCMKKRDVRPPFSCVMAYMALPGCFAACSRL